MIYLDYAAASPALPEMFASPGLFSGGIGDTENARAQILRLLHGGADPGACILASGEVGPEASVPTSGEAGPGALILTSGGTESDNLAILGSFFRAKREGRSFRLVTSAAEHEAVLQSVNAAEEYGEIFGVDVKTRVLPVTEAGAADPEEVRNALEAFREASSSPLILASFMYANNETGVLTDLETIGRICHEAGALLHTDAVQAVGHVPVDLRTLPVDMLSASAHKFGGPKGAGFLYVRKGVQLEPLFYGEEALRPGTPCTYGVIGMARALAYRTAHLQEEQARIRRLRDLLQEGILKEIPGTHVNGGNTQAEELRHVSDPRLPGHLNVSFDGIESASLLFLLDMQGICASGGSACAALSRARSHVLTAMGLSPERVDSAVRFSLGAETTEAEIRETLQILKQAVSDLRALRGLPPASASPSSNP